MLHRVIFVVPIKLIVFLIAEVTRCESLIDLHQTFTEPLSAANYNVYSLRNLFAAKFSLMEYPQYHSDNQIMCVLVNQGAGAGVRTAIIHISGAVRKKWPLSVPTIIRGLRSIM